MTLLHVLVLTSTSAHTHTLTHDLVRIAAGDLDPMHLLPLLPTCPPPSPPSSSYLLAPADGQRIGLEAEREEEDEGWGKVEQEGEV